MKLLTTNGVSDILSIPVPIVEEAVSNGELPSTTDDREAFGRVFTEYDPLIHPLVAYLWGETLWIRGDVPSMTNPVHLLQAVIEDDPNIISYPSGKMAADYEWLNGVMSDIPYRKNAQIANGK